MREAARQVLYCFVALAFICASGIAAAQGYPSRPLRLVVPYPPGGSNDIVGRMVAMQLGERLGQQVVVDNRAGAGGTLGTDVAAKAPPDGYTLLLVSVSHAFNPSIYSKLSYDPDKSFAPVAMLGTGPVVVLVSPNLGVGTLAELIALAKAKPGQLNYASAGVGSLQHLASALFVLQAGLDVVHVPYKGGGQAMVDVIAGQAQFSVASLIQSLPHMRSGKLKGLAMSGAKRSPLIPEVPTVSEAGVPGYEAYNWWGLLAPAGTPAPMIERLHAAVTEILTSKESAQRFESEGAEAVRMTPAEFGRFVAAETAKWAKVAREAGIRAE
jgi:tripartite-type tricarboxylate transporter receptor subunit TctC